MAKTTETAKPKPTAKPATNAPAPSPSARPSGKDYKPSAKYQYHKEQANLAFQSGDIVKTSNHLLAMRRAEQTLHEQAKWAKEHKGQK